ncbi:isopentenyl-diphosphate Delta-isomerase [Tessaracoccus rhinocerotis]|uniref:Isopentenyl-diphosphate Delta-isomerase n=1 Tax=Tessaracoccus rhinocerotis TaxID=1689449 RepID=A0A553K0G7_9ACTN|nr:isopentenyl-diphosphate Delta-isomerase [Tessaracoccus rhinocerotis]TRY18189.1 isopentenyl-diphosphate Delta-isomerase [Tessaracoccus rhinocerotis]
MTPRSASEPTARVGAAVPDDVVLVDDAGRPIGRADRTSVHTDATPLHLAFSTYLFNAKGQVLVTRRALAKKTWPGVWTNSCCGHPRPGESLEDAARRRIREELGLHVGPLVPLLPDFRYRASDASGIVENEVCPVFAGFVTDESPALNPDEVAEWAWVDWDRLTTAVSATPHVYSPWAALQVPLIEAAFPGVAHLERRPATDVTAAVRDVDALLSAELEALQGEWWTHVGGLGVDVLPHDLPGWLGDLLVGRGKRLRVVTAYWGFIAAGGVPGSPAHHHLTRAMAALETLHLFALVHDDVMDESLSRRGRPSAHVQAASWHREAAASGSPEVFGRNLAILLGDLAHTVADRLVDGLPAPMRHVWYELSVELIAGQRADLTGAAAARRDRPHAEQVARLKSGRYTVVRPLQLAAVAAGAPAATSQALLQCGEHIGEAFALRDEYLGVWGDPEVTGKPCSDDLLEGKATVALSIAAERLVGRPGELLAKVGRPEFTEEEVAELADAMRAAGVDSALEDLIRGSFDAALACLEGTSMVPDGLAGLQEVARAMAWRDA